MAQFILKDKLKKAGVGGVEVTSFGLDVTEKKMRPEAIEALSLIGVKRTRFTPKQLKNAEEYDALITMTNSQKSRVKSKRDNVYSLDELTGSGDIADPYGKSLNDYISVAKELDEACGIVLNILRRL